jgi:hypothetical protein
MKKNTFKFGLFLLLLVVISFFAFASGNNLPAFEVVFYKNQSGIFFKNNEIQNPGIVSSFNVLKIKQDSIITSINNRLYQLTEENNQPVDLNAYLPKPVENLPGSRREINDVSDNGVFLLFKHTILKKNKVGYQPLKTNISGSKRFVSIASDQKYLYVGTAVDGLFYAKIHNGMVYRFQSMNQGLPYIPYDNNIKFYEEIRSLHVTSAGDLIAGTGIYGGVYIKTHDSNKFKKLTWPSKWKVSSVYYVSDNEKGTLWVSCTQGLVIYYRNGNAYDMKFYSWKEFDSEYDHIVIRSKDAQGLYGYANKKFTKVSREKEERMITAGNKKLFYSSPYNFKFKKDMLIKLLQSNNFNGLVLDVKDDHGYVLYDSQVPFIKKSNAIRPVIDLKKFIELAHQNKKYLAVRIVVFKDPVLFKNNSFAIWDKVKNKPWEGNPGEKWVDPYNPELAQKYYVPLIQELTDAGVDEIQLDYIRFPGEGQLQNCLFRYKKDDKYLSEAIEDFLIEIRNSTNLPVSIDIFGYQGLYRSGGSIGQDMEVFGSIVDVISPMLYSSHFGDRYLTDIEKEKRVFRLIEHSIQRAEFISGSEYLIRPYLQAFPMKNNIWGYGEKYFLDQVKASNKGDASGFSFWGSIENMAAVDSALAGQ